MTHPADLGGVLMQLRDGKLHIARAVLAVRRGDSKAAECHLQSAQRAIAIAEIDADERSRDKERA